MTESNHPTSSANEKDYRIGHRERLRTRFSEVGLAGLQDYEALELLLLFVQRQKDMKPIAHALVDRFGSFKNVHTPYDW